MAGILRIVFILIALLILGLAALGGYIYYKSGGEPFRVEGVTLYLDPDSVTPDSVPVLVVVDLVNNTGLSVRVDGGSIEVYLNDLKIAVTEIPTQDIKAGETEIEAEVTIDNKLLDELVYTHLSSGEASNLKVSGEVSLGLGPLTVPIPIKYSTSVETQIFPVTVEVGKSVDLGFLGSVVVESARIELAGVKPDMLDLTVYVKVRNDSRIPVVIGALGFGIYHVEAEVDVAEGYVEGVNIVKPGESIEVPVPVTVDLTKIPQIAYHHLKNGERSTIRISIWISLDVEGKRVEVGREAPLFVERTVETSFFEKR
ncbi:MAG: hypothetical protein F7B17_03800 [Desulfurococcales archaeon]|nr:hypothetical protein [Desulfurococcales archaeon]